MSNGAEAQAMSSRRVLRVTAFLLSLITPGAGHFLLGAFRRGVAWAVGLPVLMLTVLFAMPVSVFLGTFLILAVIGLLGRVAAAIDTARLDSMRPSWKLVLIAWGALLVAGLFVVPLAAYYTTHYAQAFTIPGGAMMPTLLAGDYIIVDKSVYRSRDPQRGDVVVFPYPPDEQRDLIKRVVALPGEQVLIRAGGVYVNGNLLREAYVEADTTFKAPPGYCGYAYGCAPTTVPRDSYFVMGDNRDNSRDSRYWGFVKREKIRGRAFTIYWSWDSARRWPRFDRIGRAL